MESDRQPELEHDLQLRPATAEDRGYILDLEERCMRAYAEALWGEWKPASIDQVDINMYEIVDLAEKRAGCLATTVTDEHLLLDSLYIEPDLQGRGIGGHLLRLCTFRVSAAGLPVRLSVLTTNPVIRFYQRHGFNVESETWERRRLVRHPD